MIHEGLLARIFKSSLGDCTNGGASSFTDSAIAVHPKCGEVFSSDLDRPAFKLVERDLPQGKYWTAYPFDRDGKPRTNGMAGGNFIYSSDSRFPNQYPISIHDRFEN